MRDGRHDAAGAASPPREAEPGRTAPGGAPPPVAAALESVSEGYVLLDCEWRFVYVNPAAERFMQRPAAEVLGRTLWESFPDAASRRFGAEYRRAVSESLPVEFEEFYPEPLNAWFEVRAYPSPEGLSIFFRDATDRRTTEQALRRSEEALRVNLTKYTVLFDSFPLGIVVTDLAGRVREVNRTAARLLGATPETMLGRRIGAPLWRVIRPDGSRMPSEEFASVRAMREQRVVEGVEMGINRPDGDILWTSVSAAPIPLDGYGVVLAFGDNSPRRRAEAALRDANADLEAANAGLRRSNETLEARVAERTADLAMRASQIEALALDRTRAEERERQKIARVVHDNLQQLLSLARINLGIARERATDRSIRKRLRELDVLIVESLDITRSITSDLSPGIVYRGTLGSALQWLGRRFENRFGLDVAVDAAEGLNVSEDVRVTLFRAARELLFNVVKHARVTAASLRACLTADGRVQITVRDEGAGFDPAILRAWDGGHGSFGLFSLREHLELIGGRLDVESAPNRGTTATIVGPAATTVAPSARPAGPEMLVPVAAMGASRRAPKRAPARTGKRRARSAKR